MRTPLNKRTNQRFCEYHNDHGHTIEDCISLHHEIENFTINGKLVRFLVEERNRIKGPQEPICIVEALNTREEDRVVRQRQNEEPRMARVDHQHPRSQDVIGEIHTISRGLGGGGKSNSARKAHARRVNAKEILFLERPSNAQQKDPMILFP